MSNKLTNKTLDLLIEQVLTEKTIPVELYTGSPTPKSVRGALGTKTDFTAPGAFLPTQIVKKIVAYAKLDPNGKENSLELLDLTMAYTQDPKEFVKTISQVVNYTKDEELKKSILAAYQEVESNIDKTGGKIDGDDTKDLDLEDVKTLTFPRPFTSSASISAGKFFGAQNDLINGIFTEGNIEDRLLKASQISEKVFAAQEELEEMTPRQLTQYSMFIDFVNAIINEADSRTSTYAFESFCAILCGGKVVGAGNGAADFLAAGGGKGSSKLFSNWAGIEQAASGFKSFPNKPFHYVIALLNKQQISEDDDDGIDIRKVVSIDLHYMVVTYVTKTDEFPNKVGFVTSNSKGEFISYQDSSISQVNLTNVPHQEMSKVGTLKLYAGQNSFKDHLDSELKDSDSNQAKALKAMEQYFLNLRKAEDNTKSYIAKSSDKPADVLSSGNAALQTFDAADGHLVTLLDILSPEKDKKVSGDKGSRKIRENKTKSLKDLDKLIERVILKEMLKK